jgi:alkylated DNA repair dioxygenase AlkB
MLANPSPLPEPLPLPDGDAVLYRHVFPAAEQARLLQVLLDETPWQQHILQLGGRRVPAPRLSAWYGDADAVYTYSRLRLEPLPWTATLLAIKAVAETLAATSFNSVLLNWYRDGQDSMGWHSDDEAELGHQPVIASVSLGAVRRFRFRHQRQPFQLTLALESGSVLVMAGATQHYWRHQLPKTRQPVGPRLNLTFRRIIPA